MGRNSGVWDWQTGICTPAKNNGPCRSVCNSPCGTSWYLAAYQNYKSCHGLHLHPGTAGWSSVTELSATPYCPILSLNRCDNAYNIIADVLSTGPTPGTGSMSANCEHGHGSSGRKIGCLNRAALVAMGAGSSNRVWAHNYITF